MASKQVNNLVKPGTRIAAATADEERNDRAMRGLIERCAEAVPEGTASLTLAEAQYYVGRQIEIENEKLRRDDDQHVKNLVGVDAQRQVRNLAATEVYGVMLRTKNAFEVLFGPGTSVKLLGLDTQVPVDPMRLFQTGDRCQSWLRDPRLELPQVDLPGFVFDREAMASGIDGPLNRLDTALAVLPQEEKHSVDTLVVKLAAMKRLDELIGRGARWLEALYDIGGMEEESDRVRLSSHHSGRQEEEIVGETSAGWIKSLKPATTHLDRLLGELERRRIGASDGVLEQRRALAACDQTYLLVARTAEALLHLGGENELARRLRPKAGPRRRRPAIVGTAAGWWRALVAACGRLRGLVVRGVETMRRQAAGAGQRREPRTFRLARGLKKAPDV